jgi:3(or 17)beta-hydroxysteroid dehydrogenase
MGSIGVGKETEIFMTRLKNKVAIVTGGASGIGAATVRLFASEGARVVIAGRSKEAGEALEAELTAAGHDVLFFSIDIVDVERWQQLMAATVARFGALHILVNNAGISYRQNVEETDIDVWNRTVAVNQTGVFHGLKFCNTGYEEQ